MKNFAFAILVLYAFLLCLAGYKLFLVATHPIKYQAEIIEVATENNISPSLVASVVNTESSFRANARSTKNALGLMQIKLSTAEYLCELYGLEKVNESKLLNPSTNLQFGCLYLKYLNEKFNNIWTSLAAYNAGETRVRVWLNNSQFSNDRKTLTKIPYKETEQYIKKIKLNLKFYKKVFNK